MMEAVFSATEGIEYQLRELAKGSSRNLLTWDVPSGIGRTRSVFGALKNGDLTLLDSVLPRMTFVRLSTM